MDPKKEDFEKVRDDTTLYMSLATESREKFEKENKEMEDLKHEQSEIERHGLSRVPEKEREKKVKEIRTHEEKLHKLQKTAEDRKSIIKSISRELELASTLMALTARCIDAHDLDDEDERRFILFTCLPESDHIRKQSEKLEFTSLLQKAKALSDLIRRSVKLDKGSYGLKKIKIELKVNKESSKLSWANKKCQSVLFDARESPTNLSKSDCIKLHGTIEFMRDERSDPNTRDRRGAILKDIQMDMAYKFIANASSNIDSHRTARGLMELFGQKKTEIRTGGPGASNRAQAVKLALTALQEPKHLFIIQVQCSAEKCLGQSFCLLMNNNQTVTVLEAMPQRGDSGLLPIAWENRVKERRNPYLTFSEVILCLKELLDDNKVARDRAYRMLSSLCGTKECSTFFEDGSLVPSSKSDRENHSILVTVRELRSHDRVKERFRARLKMMEWFMAQPPPISFNQTMTARDTQPVNPQQEFHEPEGKWWDNIRPPQDLPDDDE